MIYCYYIIIDRITSPFPFFIIPFIRMCAYDLLLSQLRLSSRSYFLFSAGRVIRACSFLSPALSESANMFFSLPYPLSPLYSSPVDLLYLTSSLLSTNLSFLLSFIKLSSTPLIRIRESDGDWARVFLNHHTRLGGDTQTEHILSFIRAEIYTIFYTNEKKNYLPYNSKLRNKWINEKC